VRIPKQVSTEKAITIILITILLTTIGSYLVFGATPSSTFTISPGIYPGAPSYTVWEEGSNYFAKNSNGKIEFSRSNASQLLQNAINNGDVIFVKAGTYLFDAVVTLINIRETNVDKLYVYNSFNQGVKIYSASCNSTISNSIFEHNGYGSGATAGSGVEVYGSHITFINCFFIDNYGAGVLTASTSIGFHTFTGCHAIKNGKNGFSIDAPQTIIVGCTSVETGRGSHTGEADAHGVQFTATAIGSSISASTIAENFHAGIDVVGAGTATNLSITIQGNIIYDNGNTSIFDSAGIHVNTGANKVFIIGNTIFDNDSTYQQYAIILDDANTSDITIYDNDLRGNTVQAILETADFAGSFEVEGNLGFVTENSGSFSNVVNGTTIAHGLAGTPTTVVITLSTQGYAWYAADATYITLYFSTSTASGSWYAKYKP